MTTKCAHRYSEGLFPIGHKLLKTQADTPGFPKFRKSQHTHQHLFAHFLFSTRG